MFDLTAAFRNWLNNLGRQLYFSDNETTGKTLLRYSLAPFVPFYVIGRSAHQSVRSLRSQSVDRPVVSVGNISLGGTGKTTFTIWLIDHLLDRDLIPAVLKRGEGSKKGTVNTGNVNLREIAHHYGDEVALLRDNFPEVPIVAAKNRLQSAQDLIEKHSPDLLILDDGFQYRSLERDLDIVLLKDEDFINNWQLPAGPLREPLRSLTRADFISIDGKNDRSYYANEVNIDENHVIQHHYVFDRIDRDGKDRTDYYRKNECLLVTTLARPSALETSLRSNGIKIRGHVRLPDHSNPNSTVASNSECDVILTEKEWVKLNDTQKRSVGVIKSDFVVDPAEPLLDEITNVAGKR